MAVLFLALAGCFTGRGGRDSAVIKPILAPAGAAEGHVEIRRLGDLANRAITESSGIAFSRRSRNLLWTENDSGDAPRLYAFDGKGRNVATVEVRGASAYDWEDMSAASLRGTPYLVIADVGDNDRIRPSCSIYLLEEPALPFSSQAQTATSTVSRVINFTYDDGPQNCEAVGIDPESETIYLVSKHRISDTKVYTLAIPFDGQTNAVVARTVATLPDVHEVTGFDISADNDRAVVLTYDDAFEYTRRSGESWATAFEGTPRRLPMPWRAQGEAICYGPDGRALYLTSENAPSPLWEVRVVNGPRATQVATNGGSTTGSL
ncbi:MAG: hypothetical protein V1873_02425 [Verrucomicrobiota bacterium]